MLTHALTALTLAATTTVPLGTHETFGATVNGATDHATIRMACFGPDTPAFIPNFGDMRFIH